MANHVTRGSYAQRVVLFFARNLDEQLTIADMVIKWPAKPVNVHRKLRAAVRDGMLECKSDGAGRGKEAVYSAGPMLFTMLGMRPPAAACAAHDDHGAYEVSL